MAGTSWREGTRLILPTSCYQVIYVIYESMEDLISMLPKPMWTKVNLSEYLGEPSY